MGKLIGALIITIFSAAAVAGTEEEKKQEPAAYDECAIHLEFKERLFRSGWDRFTRSLSRRRVAQNIFPKGVESAVAKLRYIVTRYPEDEITKAYSNRMTQDQFEAFLDALRVWQAPYEKPFDYKNYFRPKNETVIVKPEPYQIVIQQQPQRVHIQQQQQIGVQRPIQRITRSATPTWIVKVPIAQLAQFLKSTFEELGQEQLQTPLQIAPFLTENSEVFDPSGFVTIAFSEAYLASLKTLRYFYVSWARSGPIDQDEFLRLIFTPDLKHLRIIADVKLSFLSVTEYWISERDFDQVQEIVKQFPPEIASKIYSKSTVVLQNAHYFEFNGRPVLLKRLRRN